MIIVVRQPLAALVAHDRRPAQFDRRGQSGRHGDAAGHHRDEERVGDPGADPNKMVPVTDVLSPQTATTAVQTEAVASKPAMR